MGRVWPAGSARRVSPVAADVALSLAVGGVQLLLLSIATDAARAAWRPVDALTVLLIAAQAVPLVARRRRPVLVFLPVLAANTAYYAGGFPPSGLDLGLAVALYTVAARRSRRVSLLCCAAILLACLTLWVFRVGPYWSRASLPLVVYLLVFFSAAWAWGRYHHVRQQMRDVQTAELVARAERAERDRAALAERILAEERARIARELHDSVAHHLSVMVVQAGAARRVLATDPAAAQQALEAIEAIEAAGRRGLTTMPSLVRALRDRDGAGAPAPQPSLARLDEMVAAVTAAGLPVGVRVDGDPRPLPPGVELSTYRVIQESLTNVLKHAGPARADVRIAYRDDALDVTVVDDGFGPARGNGVTTCPGHGLLGMRERVHLFGGEFQAGGRPGGGFAVHARFPLAAGTA